jgi:hypothetical protein
MSISTEEFIEDMVANMSLSAALGVVGQIVGKYLEDIQEKVDKLEERVKVLENKQ